MMKLARKIFWWPFKALVWGLFGSAVVCPTLAFSRFLEIWLLEPWVAFSLIFAFGVTWTLVAGTWIGFTVSEIKKARSSGE